MAQDARHAGPAARSVFLAEVVWTDRALAHVEAIVTYIVNQHSPLAAQSLGQRLLTAGDTLETSPDRGRPIARGRRELTVIAPYLIRYRLKGDRVIILEVRHGMRRPNL
ncbi:plasmid stabilization system protein ParE [Caulobacter rhizosphaerae]|jgi:plasmid stabilization system protein ParE|uniref:Plasmid stabilization system protein ParE n=1 Tax=Caulobacter rhizosphaerae TaxID=2010972 RepID=A0ABU1N710_9CAUL|nr:type II toxin-antitoxin system RelE/ParE family toxin [Caulobacter rhizosphaerae]MDR6533820.1 plasmid stabilization system protein ParE [Caulobacter rhizosphaerae]